MATIVSSFSRLAALFLLLAMAASAASINIGRLTHFLGNGSVNGSTNGAGTGPNGALLWRPNGCSFDAAGNLYFADSTNYVVRRVLAGSRTTTTWLGGMRLVGDQTGNGTAARFGAPYTIRFSPDGTLAYVADFATHKIYRVTTATASVENFVGSVLGLPGDTDATGAAARFNGPADLVIHTTALDMYVTENLAHRVRKVTNAGVVSLWAGSTTGVPGNTAGTGSAAHFNSPHGIVLRESDSVLFVADSVNRIIRMITSARAVTTFAGNGTIGQQDGVGTSARFVEPWGLALDRTHTHVYIADKGNNAIRRLDITTAMVDTVVGTFSNGWTSSPSSVTGLIASPNGLCFINSGAVARLYITGDNSISYVSTRRTRTLTLTLADATSRSSTAAANATGTSSSTTAPGGSTVRPSTTGPRFTTFPGGSTLAPNSTFTGNQTAAPGERNISAAQGPLALLPAVAAAIAALVLAFAA